MFPSFSTLFANLTYVNTTYAAVSYDCVKQAVSPSPYPSSAVPYMPAAQYNALYELYTATGGGNWTWKQPYHSYGIPWDFSGNYSDPCTDEWQGKISTVPVLLYL